MEFKESFIMNRQGTWAFWAGLNSYSTKKYLYESKGGWRMVADSGVAD